MNLRKRHLSMRAGPLLVCALIVGCEPTTPIGPVPQGGYDYTRMDYERAKFPAAPVVEVPLFDVADTAPLPFSLSPPDTRYDLPLAVAGEIVHPHPGVKGSVVRVGILELPIPAGQRPKRAGGMRGFAKGEEGRLAYRLEGRAPEKPGRYLLRIEVEHPIVDPDIESLPIDERMTWTILAEGELVVTR